MCESEFESRSDEGEHSELWFQTTYPPQGLQFSSPKPQSAGTRDKSDAELLSYSAIRT